MYKCVKSYAFRIDKVVNVDILRITLTVGLLSGIAQIPTNNQHFHKHMTVILAASVKKQFTQFTFETIIDGCRIFVQVMLDCQVECLNAFSVHF